MLSVPSAARLRSLDAVRCIAAVSVMIFHISGAAFESFFGTRPVGDALAFGYSGLDLFFVLSGFVIFYVHWNDIGRPERLGNYIWNRITRIYPPYWAVTLLCAGVVAVSHTGLNLRQLVSSMLLIPGVPLLLSVGWTLCHEVLFYAIFAIVIFSPRIGLWLGSAWLLASLLVPQNLFPLSDFLFNIRHIEFFIGGAAAWSARHINLKQPLMLAVTGSALFAVTAILDVWKAPLRAESFIVAYGLSGGVVILGAVLAERMGQLRIARAVSFLGEASYAIYLTHLMSFSVTARLAAMLNLHHSMPGWMLLILLSAVIITMGVAFHLCFERPVMGMCRSMRAWFSLDRRDRNERRAVRDPGIG